MYGLTVEEDGTYSGGDSYNPQNLPKNLEDCEASRMIDETIVSIASIIVGGGVRLWFALNIRDWRDALRDRKPAGTAEAAGA